MFADNFFAHIFKQVKSEYLVTSDDGEFVDMECTTWLDLSQEMEQSVNSEPAWRNDFSLIKSDERNDIIPLMPISDELADQLLHPLLGHCLDQKIDVWKYSLCVGAFSRQEMIVSTSQSETYSLGVNKRLSEENLDKLHAILENPGEKTSEIAKMVLGKPFDPNLSDETIVEWYIERSRKNLYDRMRSKLEDLNIENYRVEKMKMLS